MGSFWDKHGVAIKIILKIAIVFFLACLYHHYFNSVKDFLKAFFDLPNLGFYATAITGAIKAVSLWSDPEVRKNVKSFSVQKVLAHLLFLIKEPSAIAGALIMMKALFTDKYYQTHFFDMFEETDKEFIFIASLVILYVTIGDIVEIFGKMVSEAKLKKTLKTA